MTNEATERLERFLVRLREAGERYAHAAATYEQFDHQRKVVLAEQMKEAEEKGATSAAAQEREARASLTYSNFLDQLFEARLELELARSDLDALKLSASLAQTIKANERAEVRAYGAT
jgi:hypothetical protein